MVQMAAVALPNGQKFVVAIAFEMATNLVYNYFLPYFICVFAVLL